MDWTVQLIKKQPKLKPLHLDCTLEKNTTNSICSIGTLLYTKNTNHHNQIRKNTFQYSF